MGNPSLKEEAQIAEKQVTKAARESAEKIRDRNEKEMVPLLHADSASFWAWWGRTSPPNNNEKEVLHGGAIKLGGGSKSKRAKKQPKKDICISPWVADYR